MEINPNFSEKAQQDYNLVINATEGDENAYAELGRYKDAIYFMLLKMTNNKSDAEDLTMEAFGKAFRNIKQYSPKYAFSTWLFKIASNNCIDFLRKKKGGKTPIIKSTDSVLNISEDYNATVHIRAKGLDPEEELIKKQKVKLLREVVGKLKPRYRRLIELRYFKEYSYEEISQELELPIGTVKAQLFRARELLFNILKNNHKYI